jgi:HEAT repeat protein
LAFATASDPIVRLALLAGIGSLAASVAMLAAVLILRLRNLASAVRERRVAARWHEVIVRSAESATPEAPRLPRREARQFLHLWNRMHESVRGEAKQRLNALARDVGADRIALRYLRSRNQRKQLIAILTLGNLEEPQALERLVPLLEDASPVVSLRAAQALLRIEAGAVLRPLFAVLARRADWPLSRVVSLLRELGQPAAVTRALAETILASLASPHPGQPIARLLKLAEAGDAERLRPAVLRVLERLQDPEIVAAALAALRHPADVDLARAHASHPEWLVRKAAAGALGRLGERDDLHLLVKLLGDANWWVRYRAAEAIVGLPWAQSHQIEHLQRALSDRFAADALRQAIAERRVR